MVYRGSRDNPMGSYTPTEEEVKAYRWCIKHNIKISPVCYTYGKSWKIDIIINGKSFKSPEIYLAGDCWKKMYEYYKYYYDKYENRV